MAKESINIQEFLIRFDRGDYKDPSVETQINAGWFDWFCKGTSLARKTNKLVRTLKAFLAGNPDIDQTTHYVWFKNNCPLSGGLYDDVRISAMGSGENQWVISVKSPHETCKYAVYHCSNFDRPIKEANSTKELRNEKITLPYSMA